MPDLLVFDEPDLGHLAGIVRLGGQGAPDAFLKLVRRVRELGRFDLVHPCRLLWPAGASAEAVREMVLLYLDAGCGGAVRQLLVGHPDLELRLSAGILLALLDTQSVEVARDPSRIWPDESLPYAAKTSIFHVQETIIARQRAMIDRLLSHASGQGRAG